MLRLKIIKISLIGCGAWIWTKDLQVMSLTSYQTAPPRDVNIFTNLNMSDMETGYKLFKKDAINSINIEEKSFGVEPEITIKLAKKNFVFYEVPISYRGRSYEQGKKIRLKDAVRAVYCIFKYKFFS